MTEVSSKDEAAPAMTESMQQAMNQLLAMGYDPNSKRNATTLDYVATLHNDTYDFIQPEQFDLNGRAVFITGASRGCGRAYAISYAKAGATKIGIGARSDMADVVEDIKAAAKVAGRAPPEILSVKLDITKAESVSKAAAEVESVFGRLDILINNSGYMDTQTKMTEADPVDWWKTWEVNVLGTFLVTRAFVPLLLNRNDSLKTLVNVSSLWGLTFFPNGSAYQMSKFALLRWAQLCDAEYGDSGLLSFTFHPGAIPTELAQPLPEVIKQFLTDTPEMAGDTMVWLTAERREWLAGRYVHGQWDMKELLEKKDRIVKEDHLKMRLAVGLK